MPEPLDYNLIDYKGFNISLPELVWVAVVYTAATSFPGIFRMLLHRNFLKRQLISRAREFTLYSLMRYGVFILTFLIVLRITGVKVNWLFGAGIPLLVGIALGLQNMFRNFVSGIVLFFEGVFKAGDLTEIGRMVAQVRKIDLRTTKVETYNGTYSIAPDSKLPDENIVSWSHNRKETRFNIAITPAYGTDTATARPLLFHCLSSSPKVSRLKKLLVVLANFGNNGLGFTLQFRRSESWIIERVQGDLRYTIENTLQQHGINIPYATGFIYRPCRRL